MSVLHLPRSAFIAIGFCLVMVGLVLRGFAREQRREDARRKQHALDERSLATPEPAPPSHLEKHLGRYANGVCLTGLVVVVLGLMR